MTLYTNALKSFKTEERIFLVFVNFLLFLQFLRDLKNLRHPRYLREIKKNNQILAILNNSSYLCTKLDDYARK